MTTVARTYNKVIAASGAGHYPLKLPSERTLTVTALYAGRRDKAEVMLPPQNMAYQMREVVNVDDHLVDGLKDRQDFHLVDAKALEDGSYLGDIQTR